MDLAGLSGVEETVACHRFEEIISQRLDKRLDKGGHLDDWEGRIKKLDQAYGLRDLIKMKGWTNQIAMVSGGLSSSIVYPFDKNQLHPIGLVKNSS